MMVFQVCIFPVLLKKVGMTVTQRLSSLSAIPMLVAVPLLTHLRNDQTALEVATVVVLFLAHSLCNAVRWGGAAAAMYPLGGGGGGREEGACLGAASAWRRCLASRVRVGACCVERWHAWEGLVARDRGEISLVLPMRGAPAPVPTQFRGLFTPRMKESLAFVTPSWMFPL